MIYKVSIDAGHSTYATSGKETVRLTEDLYINGVKVKSKGQRIKENEFNRLVATALGNALIRCGIQVKYVSDMTGKVDTPLNTRSYQANIYGSNLHVSCHYNAIGSCNSWQTKCHGLLVLKTINCGSKTDRLANCVHNALRGNYSYSYGVGTDTKWCGFTLAILRNTNMPAILLEYGFMDYKEEALNMLNPNWYNKLAEDTCKGICNYLGVTYKYPLSNNDTVNDDTYYRVVTGSYLVRESAEKERDSLRKIGYNAFLVAFENGGKTYLRVVAKSCNDRNEANKIIEDLKIYGYNPFISIYKK